MFKKIFLMLLLSFTTTIACAEGYLYMENPNPDKYAMKWDGPEPNCSEVGPSGYETKGWIMHPSGGRVSVRLVLKDEPDVVICKAIAYVDHLSTSFYLSDNCNFDETKNTSWVTVVGSKYKTYRTWACG